MLSDFERLIAALLEVVENKTYAPSVRLQAASQLLCVLQSKEYAEAKRVEAKEKLALQEN